MECLSKNLIRVKPVVDKKVLEIAEDNNYYNCEIKFEIWEGVFRVINDSMIEALYKIDNVGDYTLEKGVLYAVSKLEVKYFEKLYEDIKDEVSLTIIIRIIKSLKKGYFYGIEKMGVDDKTKNILLKYTELFFDNLEIRFINFYENNIYVDPHMVGVNKSQNDIIEFNKYRLQFSANVSHELRTPINIILSAIQVLELEVNKQESDIKKDRLLNYVGNIKNNCYRVVKVINNLIDISKIDYDYFEVNLQNYDIVSVIEDITLSVATDANPSNIEIIFDTEVEEKIIACDKRKVERIMLNLLSNAIKFTPSGGIIKVSIYDRGENIVISVKDTGIGIPEDIQVDIFDKFIQVDKSLSRNKEGSGMGLFITKSFVNMHKGKIYFNSKIDKGSEFIFELPATFLNEENECAVTREPLISQSNKELVDIEFSDIY